MRTYLQKSGSDVENIKERALSSCDPAEEKGASGGKTGSDFRGAGKIIQHAAFGR